MILSLVAAAIGLALACFYRTRDGQVPIVKFWRWLMTPWRD